MITTVCMNPCFDKTVSVEKLEKGEVNRVSDVRYDVGGKGINVAIVLRRLGVDVSCVGCIGKDDEAAFRDMLSKESVDFEALRLDGKIRTNLKVIEQKTGSATEINESGPVISEEQIQKFLELLKKSTQDSDIVVLSGSVPVGSGKDIYRRCMEQLDGKKCVLDTSGDMLLEGLKAKPYLIKPNLPELESLMKKELRTLRSIRDAALTLIEKGAQNVIVSMGRYGATYVSPTVTLFAPALQVEARSTVGAGDAMIGGVVMGLAKGAALGESLKYGAAAGAASVMTEGTQLIKVEAFEKLLPKVCVQAV